MNTDPIADMLTRIRNASRAERESVSIPHSRIKKAIADIMQKKGFIQKVGIMEEQRKKSIHIELMPERKDIMLTRKSKPGRRHYLASREMRPVHDGYGVGIVSTSQGVMTTEQAQDKKVGGEYICEVY